MLIPLHTLIKKHKLKISGIVHGGANTGQEYADYCNHGISNIVWIEPCKAAFEQLQANVSGLLFNCAIGAEDTEMVMNVESRNGGQSNSLLKPAMHTHHYPDIVFHDTENVTVYKLDNLDFDRAQYNFLNLDLQGYELEALKGAISTLKHIDYIYTEVNRAELYEGCAQFDDLCVFLAAHGYSLAEVVWVSEGWGDALFTKRSNIYDVPKQFQPVQRASYPAGNYEYERWFFDHTPVIESERIYLPVFWTGYFTNSGYGLDAVAKLNLQKFIDRLPRDRKYWTICQYDEGCLVDWKGLDVRVYGMSGGQIDYPLPLICTPAPVQHHERIYKFSFVGSITHPLRQEVVNVFGGRKDCYISTKKHNANEYNKVLAQSEFAICPRGYGQSSFRVMEALNQGAVPVYLSDVHLEPHNHNFKIYGYPFNSVSELVDLEKGLVFKSVQRTFEEYYTYEATQKLILKDLLTCK